MATDFLQLIDQHKVFLFGKAMRLTKNKSQANDLVQETIVKLLKNEHRFDMKTSFEAWSWTIMRNAFINDYRKDQSKKKWVDASKHLIGTSGEELVNNEGEQNLELATIEQAIQNLNEKVKIPFQLFFQGFHYAEIAEQLDRPLGTIKSQIFLAREQLKTELKEYRVG